MRRSCLAVRWPVKRIPRPKATQRTIRPNGVPRLYQSGARLQDHRHLRRPRLQVRAIASLVINRPRPQNAVRPRLPLLPGRRHRPQDPLLPLNSPNAAQHRRQQPRPASERRAPVRNPSPSARPLRLPPKQLGREAKMIQQKKADVWHRPRALETSIERQGFATPATCGAATANATA